MGNTVLALFGVAFAATLCELLLPGEEGGTKTALRLMVSLAVLLLLARPFLSFIGTAPEIAFEELVGETPDESAAHYQEIFDRAVREGCAQDLKVGLLAMLAQEYGIAEEDADIYVHFDDEGDLTLIEIYLSGTALLCDPDTVAADIASRLHCETEVR